jgi:membrane-associated protein
MIEFIEPLLSSPWAYAIILGIAALDALVPAVPSEATVITAGVLAGVGDLSLLGIIGAGAAGAFIGDTTSYGTGRLLSGPVNRWLQRSSRRQRESARAAGLLERRGPLLIVSGRFIPGGRTAATLTSGVVRYRFKRFLLWAAMAAGLWASYAGLAGYLGGRVFADQPLIALGGAFAVAAGLVAIVVAAGRIRRYGYPYGGRRHCVPPSSA